MFGHFETGFDLIWMNTLQIIFYYIKGYTRDLVKVYTYTSPSLSLYIKRMNTML